MSNVIIYFIILSIIGYVLCSIDKLLATKHLYRISENTLYIISLLGGSFGVLCGMYMWRHKTIKKSFKYKIFIFFSINLLLFYIIYYRI